MSKITKSERITQLEQIALDQARAFKIMADRLNLIEVESKWIIHMTGIETPKLKQLDQSVFDELDEKWRFAAVDADGSANGFDVRVYPRGGDKYGLFAYADDYANSDDNSIQLGEGYDASNWQNSLIEREKKELTGSDLCRAMLARGEKIVLCIVRDYEHENDIYYDAITHCSNDYFESTLSSWRYAIPINNQGEPLTAAEVGL